MFRKMPFILLMFIAVLGMVHSWIPVHAQSILYGISLSIKALIVFFLPCLIFGLLLKASIGFSRTASKTILFLIGAIIASNFLSTLFSFCVGKLAYQFNLSMDFPAEGTGLDPAFILALPKWIGNDIAMGSGLLLGIFLGRFKPSFASKVSVWIDWITGGMLKALLYVIPLFLSGFFIKMYHDQIVGSIIRNYGPVFGIIVGSVFGYVLFLYFLASRQSSFLQVVKNMIPAAVTGFGSMSSAAAMPLTILGAEKNAKNPEMARSIIPMTVNVHLIGDCFAIPIFAFAVMKSFGIPDPSFLSYLIFAGFFVLAKFSVAAVPGGGILVMLPILEAYLGFNSTMLSLITALYILFDPIITAANVLGNGAFAMHLSRINLGQKSERSAKVLG
ncbi:MAG: dicarboxylate/amino acid:cation symporter [Parachlamydiales bacterium]|nr:dicarboxylate/amino acid:cation symporter [Parachlamydiales bacterium]